MNIEYKDEEGNIWHIPAEVFLGQNLTEEDEDNLKKMGIWLHDINGNSVRMTGYDYLKIRLEQEAKETINIPKRRKP